MMEGLIPNMISGDLCLNIFYDPEITVLRQIRDIIMMDDVSVVPEEWPVVPGINDLAGIKMNSVRLLVAHSLTSHLHICSCFWTC
jgi:hypothetical protein